MSKGGAGTHKRSLRGPSTWAPRMRIVNVCTLILATLICAMTLQTLSLVLTTQREVTEANEAHQSCQAAVDELQGASDLLTNESRAFVSTGEKTHLNRYLAEVFVIDSRSEAQAILEEHSPGSEATRTLEEGRAHSDELAVIELYAMRLMCDAIEHPDMPDELAAIDLTEEDAHLTGAKKRARAYDLLHDSAYQSLKLEIDRCLQLTSRQLVDVLRTDMEELNVRLEHNMHLLRTGVVLLLVLLAFIVVMTSYYLLRPIIASEAAVRLDEPLKLTGAMELRSLTAAYNEMYALNRARTESLSFEARNDALTGVLNRGSFDSLLEILRHHCALLLVDIDNFKTFNDVYGHEMGDAILVEVAATLYASFRSTDSICRIGGDEFAVIMGDVDPSLRDVIARKVEDVADFLRDTENGLPAATVSVGIAFGYAGIGVEELFCKADGALYVVKERGRDGYAFADEVDDLTA